MIQRVCVVGAGTMGSGIALAAAAGGLDVILFDLSIDVIKSAEKLIAKNLGYLVEKNKLSESAKDEITGRLQFSALQSDCVADLVIEAILEKIEVKQQLFAALALINSPQTILASNTSSLSISEIQGGIPNPERVVGMHFFNPANIMKLVEVVKGNLTSDEVSEKVAEVCTRINKTAVICYDAPGFIVNRVARPYYLEAMHLVENGIAGIEDIDAAMEACGFKMGPFRLMDLIGMDINFAVSESIYNAFSHAERFRPSDIQKEKVARGELGKKTGKGFYSYPAGK